MPLCEFDNIILTPHIGGSTQEDQENIGTIEVAGKLGKLIKYSDKGFALSAINFPDVSLPEYGELVSRLLHIYENRPGVFNSHQPDFLIASGRGDQRVRLRRKGIR